MEPLWPCPSHGGGTMVMSTGSSLHLSHQEDIAMTCHTAYRFCSIHVSHRYIQSTLGLMGTYDRELYNEWRLPNGHIATSYKDFLSAYSWKDAMEHQGDHLCSIDADMEDANDTPTAEEKRTCHALFLDPKSTLRPGFSLLNPNPYFHLCLHCWRQARKHAVTPWSGTCPSSLAYIRACQGHGKDLPTPEECRMDQ